MSNKIIIKEKAGLRLTIDETTARRQRDYGSCLTTLRFVVLTLLMMFLGVSTSLGQPVEITTSNDIANNTKKLYLIQTNQFQSFYMISNSNNVSTANIPNAQMLWYFLDAGEVSGTQYYYIINNSTGKCIFNHNGNSRGIQLTELNSLSDADKEKCKFKLVEDNSNGTIGFYNIDVKANQSYYGLNKHGGSVNKDNPIRLTNNDYIHDPSSKWKFIPYNGTFTWPDPPFTPSTNSQNYCYKIHNKTNGLYYVSSDASSPKNVTISSTESDNMVWYFKEASTDSWIKYYYIVNPAAGQYMYYKGTVTNGSDQNDAIILKEKTSENEDRFQFIIVQTARVVKINGVDTPVDGCYTIIPKLLKDQYWKANSISPTDITDGNPLGIKNGRGSDTNNAHWLFEPTEYSTTCERPTITYYSSTGKATITTTTSGTTIHYTTDGTTEPSSSVGTLYEGPFDVTGPITIKAIATKTDFTDSEVTTVSFDQVATPTIQNNGSNAISITCNTDGATIYYTTDNSTPTTSSTEYTGPLTENVSGVTIKAIAVKDGMINSAVGTGSVTLQCAKPVITRSGSSVTITCDFPASASIYYTKNGDEPSSSSTLYNGAISVQLHDVIKAIAIANGYDNSLVATKTIYDDLTPTDGKYLINSQTDFETFLDMANEESGAGYHYVLKTNVSAGSGISQPFTGIFEADADAKGNFYKISGLDHALFNSINGGTVKNVILDNVNISGGTNAGAICNEANGATRIYNCGVLSTGTTGSSVSGSGHVGSIVGSISGNTRVINCYSYANVKGGSYTAGIVGYNSVATTQENVSTAGMVMNCMFYGDITKGSNISPVYGGELIDNSGETGINNYNYYRRNSYDRVTDTYVDDVTFDNNMALDSYHRSWPADAKYLIRFEYYRSILNSNRKLCTWWVNGTEGVAPTDDDVTNVGIAKWVLDPSIAPYPILKKWGKYSSVINQDPARRINPSTKAWVNRGDATTHWGKDMVPDVEGQKLGTISVTIYNGRTPSSSKTPEDGFIITAMDTLYHDYCYGKIQLPYYNDIFGNPNGNSWEAKYGGNYTDKVVTGWEISGGSAATDYNFADRSSYSGRVFAQGGYFYVPKGVTSITITAHWADAVYLCNKDYSLDRVNVASGGKKGSQIGVAEYGSSFTPTGSIPSTFHGQAVYTTIQDAIGQLGTSGDGKDVYNQAIVLIGNVQVRNHSSVYGATGTSTRPFTIMSADLDFDNEPDNCLELQFRNDIDRPGVQPIRFDFLPVPELGLAIRTNKLAYSIGLMIPLGHFEITETAFMHTTQFEYDANYTRNGKSPVIINGGEHEMFTVRKHASDRTSYFLLGGNAWIHRFAPGAHPNTGDSPAIYLCPINVIGGEIKELYLSGLYRPELSAPANQGDPSCYIDGGYFDIIAGAGYEQVAGNVTFKINHSLIEEFYGGGINGTNPIGGNIDVTIDNSWVTKKYCGGPKVGNMTGKTVTTHATGTTFEVFYGGGNGGNSYYRQLQRDGDMSSTHIGTWNDKEGYNWNGFSPVATQYDDGSEAGQTGKDKKNDNKGYHAEYEFEVFNQSNGLTDEITQRGFIKWIQFGVTITGNVENTLTNCIVENSFYGGGNLATVDGTVTSTLTNTTVNGSVFGAGYSAAIPTFKVHDKSSVNFPSMDAAGTITDGTIGYDTNEYEWTNDLDGVSGHDAAYMKTHPTYQKGGKWYCYTWNLLENLGKVMGNATLNIKGTTTVAGNVYGGGEESDVAGNTEVSICANYNETSQKWESTSGTVTITGHVFGGGKGDADEFTCSKAMIGTEGSGVTVVGEDPDATYTLQPGGTKVIIGNGTVNGNVYGGGEVGRVEKNTLVMIGAESGTSTPEVRGSVFGAGAGVTTHGYSALVRGDATVTIQGTAQVWKNVYGGGEKASVGRYYVASSTDDENNYHVPIGMPCYLKAGGKCTVNILGSATIGTDNNENTGHVFGAGQGVDPHAVTYTYQSNETKPKRMKNDNTWEYFGNESAYLTFVETLARASETDVNISGGTIKGSVFGGSESGFVYHSTDINIQNGTINGNVFGGGKGLMTYAEAGRVRENTKVTMSDGTVKGNVYGGGSLGDVGRINKTLTGYNYKWTDDAVSNNDAADKTYEWNNTGKCEIEINGGTIGTDNDNTTGHVFGAGKGLADTFYCEKAMVYTTDVSVTAGTVKGNIYGGGQLGRVEDNTVVTIGTENETTGSKKPDIKGGVFGAGAGVATHGYSALVRGNSTVTVQGKAEIEKNVYGGGEAASVGRFRVENSLPKEPLSGGTCTVTIQGDAKIGTGNTGGSVYGACKGVEPGDYSSATHVISNGTSPGFANNAEYLAFLKTLALTSNTIVTIAGNASVNGSVYGGGRRGITLGRVQVSMTGGTVNQDVYGGGALADTNTGNWNADYGSVAGITAGTTIVTGYYTRSGAGTQESPYTYTEITAANTTAAENTTYYSRNSWAHATLKSAYYTTTVNLTSGIIRGDVYGGGLGRQAAENVTAVEATVYGNVTVNLNDNNGTCYVDGSVFGCNNTNGSPKGDVEVHIYNTVHLDGNNVVTTAPGTGVYELKAVYGGGKKAEYNGTDRTAKVYIETCDPSIEEVYGGGFGADVPNTYVEVKGAHEIHYVFGGGYGADTQGFTNPGANVNGTTEVLLKGGTVHEVYGGSNTKGNITGGTNVNVSDESNEGCPLTVEHIYGGGKNANMSGSANIILGCQPDAWIEDIYAGSREADVEGDVSLTITSGKFERVFGGNKTSGKLKGSITVNIEETGDCSTPIIIGELYAGGNEAHYSIYGYKDNGDPMTADELRTKLTTDNPGMTAEQIEALFQATKKAEPQLNVRAFTSIGAIYGGGYSAEMYADPTVSINVVKGSLNTTVVNDNQYTPSAAPFHHLPYPAHASGAIGTIGNVFGGGNLATVHGSTTVNIGTESHIYFKTEPTHLGTEGTDYIEQADGSFKATVEGANITGNVYGGGNLADVTGNTQINVCAVYDEENDKYDPVAEGASKVTIGGDIFGGGKGEADNFFCDKAMVGTDGAGADAEHYPNYADGNTTIIIGNGTVNGNVYGGGEVGRVEMNTSVTVGLGDGVASGGAVTSAPEIIHSVFGGGKGVKTHGYSALVRGNPTVTIQGNAKVRDNVYGGGEIASVARYNVPRTQAQVDAAKALGYDAVLGMPYALKDVNSGSCTVTIQGYAEIGPETIGSDNTTSIGHVFGAGKGIVPGGTYAYQQGTTKRMVLYDGDVHTAANTHWEYVDPTHSDTNKNVWEKFADEAAYITFVQTLALSSRTNVTIDGNAKVKGSVFGGSESGFVQFNTNVNVEGGTIGVEGKGGADFGNVYGGGKGDVVSTGENENYVAAGIVKGNTKVLVSQASGKTTKIYHNVYGGGAYGTVGEFVYGADGLPTGLKTYTVGETVQTTEGGKTEIYITGGTIGTNGDENGMIFGSSRGDVGAPGSIHDKAAWVYDTHVAIGDTTANATITPTTPLIKGSVYGGGENGHNFHNAYVRINGGTIGITEGENLTYTENGQSVTKGGAAYPYRGNVYGGGCGTDKYNNNTLYNPLAGIVQGNAIVNITAGNVVHNVYGAGAMGSVGKAVTTNDVTTTTGGKTTISIGGGTIGVSGTVGDGNVFGAARGDLSATGDDLARVRETSVTVSGGTVKGNVYGGGQLGDVGTIDKTDQTNYNYTWKKSDGTNNTANNNKISGTNTNTGICTVTISGGTIEGNVFGAGKGDASTWWCEKAIAYATNVSVTKGTINGNVYGGGELGRVEDDAKVTIGTTSGSEALTITGSVYGAGAGIKTHGYSALVRGNSDVIVQGVAQIGGSVYGGGEIASVGRFKVIGGLPSKPQAGGTCTVTIQGSAKIGTDGTGHNVFGACKGVTPAYNNTQNDENRSKSMQLYANRPKDANGNELAEHTYWDYYETYPNNYAGPKFVWVYYPTKADYLSFLKTLALTSNTHVTIDGSSEVRGSVYGGGERGVTLGGVDVNMTGGTVFQDVYGGGSLADSNTAMWNATDNKRYDYVELDLINGLSIVTGYYTKSGDTYTLTSDVTAQSGTTYYAKYKTNVNLTGGMIKGDAYGGGLGQLGDDPIEAMVYGDVSVNQGTLNVEGAATAYTISYLTDNSEPAKQVVNSGRIFGCNNLNGSPKGNVTVTVYGTVTGKDASGNNLVRTTITRDQTTHVVTSVPENHTYEVAAVYGGGNLADYAPADGDVKVCISSCDVSIEEVYGGGNAARVPSTDVLVTGAHEIEHVFGGGNGEDKYYLNGEWHENPGADIDGDANTLLKGGLIHEAYGGSNEKGTITGNITIDTGTGGLAGCPVKVDKLVGAGKNADVNGNLIMVLGCYPTTKTPLIFAGADNANVNGDVELTITSGTFGRVFGGNNEGGAIRGHIKLNIEETGCNPIVIDELYLGGNNAAYSRYGYYVKTEQTEAENGNGVGASGETAILTNEKLTFIPRTSTDDPHLPVKTYEKTGDTWTWTTDAITGDDAFDPYAQPVLNVTSCTSIGEVFGGGYGVGGTMYADPTVNINMIPGEHANGVLDVMTAKELSTSDNPDKLGVIGNVYGGGNAADVIGNPTVNIGTASTVQTHTSYNATNGYIMSENQDVKGAYINGNVFGAGKGKNDTFTCEKAMVGKDGDGLTNPDGGPTIIIYKGKVNGNVYGGGEIGRVEKNTVVTIGKEGDETSAPEIRGYVFGGGKGLETHGYSALVRGNPTVTIQGSAKIGKSVYGGGQIASVGNFFVKGVSYPPALNAPTPPADFPEGMPYALKDDNSGKCTVIVRDKAEIGPDNMKMEKRDAQNNLLRPDDLGHVFGAGKGIMPYEDTNDPKRMDQNSQWESYANNENGYITFIETLGMTASTDVTITGDAFVKGSVYGGSENGHVLHNTKVTIAEDCQIGNGDGKNRRYTDTEWTNENPSDFAECASWPYGKQTGTDANNNPIIKYLPYDVYDYVEPNAANPVPKAASDGHTYYGNVFGGGSGIFPYKKKAGWQKNQDKTNEVGQPVDENGYSDGIWLRSAGAVFGNTEVNITGGHILTSVYGGNECTDVGKYQTGSTTYEAGTGHCTVNMVGGTVGVPRTLQQMQAHPVTCYLFGAGKGDQRINFNTWTNVASTQVNISGTARIYGSTFGGGEDGHVIGDAETNIGGTVTIGNQNYTPTDDLIIGTTGTSYADGNVFGGGRGFSGDAQTAGSVGGNIRLNISGGKMLGSIYGGGRLASVGTQFAQPEDPDYGQFKEDDNNKTYGHVTVNISGCTIGNESGNAVSGNVFGGSMGRLTLLDNTINPLWPELAQVKSATVNITQPEGKTTLIKRNVYGGGEYGTVRENTYVTIGGTRAANGTISPSGKPTINGSVYGGGYGSDDYGNPTTAKVYWNNDWLYYTYTPMQWAGCVGGNTTVSVAGGHVKQNVYGGGQLASVGIIDYSAQEDANGISTYNNKKYSNKNIEKHADIVDEGLTTEKVHGFGLSWPYEFTYVPCKPNTTEVGGKTTVNVTGGRIGTGWDDGTGYVFGAGKGKAFERYTEAFCANVRETEVNINYGTTAAAADVSTADCIASAVYGGGEDGHVYENTAVNITGGLIGLSVYGGGKGEGTYKGKLRSRDGNHDWNETLVDLPSWTAGKVYGNTSVNMSGGHVLVNIYGGGNMGSVGKGNYAGGTDDYYPAGYGETLTNEGLWTSSNSYNPAIAISTSNKPVTMADYFLGSGKTSVTITGGTVGTKNTVYGTVNLLDQKTPTGMVFGGSRGRAAEDIGALSPRYAFAPDFFLGYVNSTAVTIGDSNGGPTIYSQVFGGGRDGHVRNSTHVIINNGTIGQAYAEYNSAADGIDKESQRRNCGNVYGSGSGMGTWNGTNHGTSSGSVTRNTTVDINGGNIYGNVYGGGAMSSVGPPKITMPDFAAENWSKCTVNINGGNIGVGTDFSTYGYGGCVFGASRGGDLTTGEQSVEGNLDNYATTLWNEVNIKGGTIAGDVYGGGQAGRVKKDNKVILTGGTVAHDVYGGGMGTSTIAANVGGNTTVTLNGTKFIPTYDTDGTPTAGRLFGCNNVNGTPKGHAKVHVRKTVDSTKNPEVALANRTTYDVAAVYGGGNNADYRPTSTDEYAEVIIEGCDLTSIKDVYGGGNAAATPANSVLVKGCYVIDNVFGGGNGTVTAANVGYNETGYVTKGTAKTNLSGGYIHNVYGGSNSQGNVLGGASVTNDKYTGDGCCDVLQVQEMYGGGKNANMFGGAEIVLGCMPDSWIDEIYAGAENADVGNDVSLTITSGKFGRVFGGNKSGGKLDGYIEVNIEEGNCDTPIIIGELYGGGNMAPYSIYGYDDENHGAVRTAPVEDQTPHTSPRVNVRAFTSIGAIYGGGYGERAVMVGSPTVNINVVMVEGGGKAYAGETKTLTDDDGNETSVVLYPHEKNKIGVIGTVFGGGNAAMVDGNTNVNIGTESSVKFESQTDDTIEGSDKRVSKTVVGADIKGNVYGGGNNAKVTGNTNVVIGQEKVTTTTP